MAAVIFHQNRAGVREMHFSSRKKLFESPGGDTNPFDLSKDGLQRVAAGPTFRRSASGQQGEHTSPTTVKEGFVLRLTAKGLWQKRKLTLSEHTIYVSAEKPPSTRKGQISLVSHGDSRVDVDRRWLVLEKGRITLFASKQEYDAMGECEASIGTSDCLMRVSKVPRVCCYVSTHRACCTSLLPATRQASEPCSPRAGPGQAAVCASARQEAARLLPVSMRHRWRDDGLGQGAFEAKERAGRWRS